MAFWLAALALCGAQDDTAVVLERCRQTKTVPTPIAQAGGYGTLDKCAALGNGNVMVTLAGGPETLTAFLGKTDYWMDRVPGGHGQSWMVLPGYTHLRLPALAGAAFGQTVDLHRAEVRTTLTKGEAVAEVRTVTLHEADNLVLSDVHNRGAAPLVLHVETCTELHRKPELAFDVAAGGEGALAWVTRRTPEPKAHNEFGSSAFRMWAALATRVLGAACTIAVDHAPDRAAGKLAVKAVSTCTLAPGQRVRVVTKVHSTGLPLTLTPADPGPAALAAVQALDDAGLDRLIAEHRAWWDAFWRRSLVRLDAEPLIERAWCGSLYLFGSACKVGCWPVGCNGWPVDDFVPWGGDYHWNYNNQAVWYGAYSSNHIDLTEPYDRTVTAANVYGRRLAAAQQAPGTLFHIATAPGHLNEPGTLGQKTHAVEAALNQVNRYYYTHDLEWAARHYPFFRDVAAYWDWDLARSKETLPNGGYRYVVRDSAPMEGAHRDSFNGITALGFLRRFYRAMIDLTTELCAAGHATGCGETEVARWRDILAHLSDYPQSFAYGRKVLAWSEATLNPLLTEQSWLLYPVFPAEQITLSSDPRQLQVARQTLLIKPQYYVEWLNNTPNIYAIAARLAHHPPEVIERFRAYHAGLGVNNFKSGGGNTENAGLVEGINSLLLQSHEGFLRLFPCWHHPAAKFVTLRAHGAFLVSAERRDGVCGPLAVHSERGKPCRVLNPWPGQAVGVTDERGLPVEVTAADEPYGQVCAFATHAGGTYTVAPVGGLPAPTPYPNAALGRPVSASSNHQPTNEPANWDAAKLTDGTRINTRAGHRGWSSALHEAPDRTEWAQVDLGTPVSIRRIDLWPLDHGDAWQHTHCTEPFVNSREIDQSYDGFPVDFRVLVSLDGQQWDEVAPRREKFALPAVFPEQSEQKVRDVLGPERFDCRPRSVRYVRVEATRLRRTRYFAGKYAMQLAEIEVHRAEIR